jgi:hypothetical protein
MDCARNEFFARSRLPANQHRATRTGDSFDLAEDRVERLATADDLFEPVLAPDFVFQIQLLLRELILEVGDLTICNRIFDRDRYLAGDPGKETDLLRSKGFPRVDPGP